MEAFHLIFAFFIALVVSVAYKNPGEIRGAITFSHPPITKGPGYNLKTCAFTGIINFGDSNSDTGGLASLYGTPPFPNGITYFGEPSGRSSDGRLIIDFMAQELGFPFLNPYLDSVQTNYSEGISFSVYGSTIRVQNTTREQHGYAPISLNYQIIQYKQFIERSQRERNKGGYRKNLMPTMDLFSKALYTIDIGHNDITSRFKLNYTLDEVKAYIPGLIDELADAIRTIYFHGGKYFWIHNTGPVGCLSYMLDIFDVNASEVDQYGCSIKFNDACQYFNLKLKETIVKLRRELPEAAITYVDIYTVKYNLFANARELGFEKILTTCCGNGGRYNFNYNRFCGSTFRENGENIIVGSCKDPTTHINWDGIHLTEAANRYVFEQIVGGNFSDSIALKEACQGI